jgi:hypothetical protein
MKIYVAGRFQSYEKVRVCINALISQGHEITHDWTRTEEFDAEGVLSTASWNGTVSVRPDSAKRAVLAAHALNDINGVRDADALVLLADDSLAGAWVEMGIALERGTPIYAVKPERWTIFLECPEVTVLDSVVDLYSLLSRAE